MIKAVEKAEELVYLVAMDLSAKGITIPEEVKVLLARRRDRSEPGWREKEAAQDELARAVRWFWRGQKGRIRDALGARAPDRKAFPEVFLDDLGDWFWENEDKALTGEILMLLMQYAVAGADLFAMNVNIGFDVSPVNAAAGAWAHEYVGDLVNGIDETTRAALRQAVDMFVRTPGVTIRDIMDALPLDDARAMRIAVTEVTRAYGQGNLLAGREMLAQVPDIAVRQTWLTNNDDLVCDLCAPLNGKTIELDEQWEGGIDAPPAHVNCRCWTEMEPYIPGSASGE